eukprot:scaffold54690_cov53-Phaeocystis_antarctica.AAC.1
MCRVQPKHQCIASRTHPARPGPLPRPEHARTHVPPCGASHRGCTRFRSGSATSGVSGDDLRRYFYVRDGVVSTVPCTSCVAAVCRSDLVSVRCCVQPVPQSNTPRHQYSSPCCSSVRELHSSTRYPFALVDGARI